MGISALTCLVLVLGCACAAPANEVTSNNAAYQDLKLETDDLKADASTSYARRYSDWGGGYPGGGNTAAGYPGGGYNSVTGYGLLDDKYSPYNTGIGGYDRGVAGYNGYAGYAGGPYGSGYGGNKGYGGYDTNSFGGGGYGQSSIGGGYGQSSIGGGYGQSSIGGGYGQNSIGGYGGYGGSGGNGGLNSYYGYNNLQYQGANHLGYGYHSKLPHGSIYYSGITPSLVTGYRGYSRR